MSGPTEQGQTRCFTIRCFFQTAAPEPQRVVPAVIPLVLLGVFSGASSRIDPRMLTRCRRRVTTPLQAGIRVLGWLDASEPVSISQDVSLFYYTSPKAYTRHIPNMAGQAAIGPSTRLLGSTTLEISPDRSTLHDQVKMQLHLAGKIKNNGYLINPSAPPRLMLLCLS